MRLPRKGTKRLKKAGGRALWFHNEVVLCLIWLPVRRGSPDPADSVTVGLQGGRETCGRSRCGVGRPAHNGSGYSLT